MPWWCQLLLAVAAADALVFGALWLALWLAERPGGR